MLGWTRVSTWLSVGVAVTGLVAACDSDVQDGDVDGATSAVSSTTGVGASTTSTGSGGSPPIMCSPGYTNITGSCDLLNSECPPDQFCNVVGSGTSATTSCQPNSTGNVPKAGDCTMQSECGPGLVCLLDKCTPFCCRDNNEPCEGGLCDVQVDYGGGKWAFVCSYRPACQLFMETCEEPDTYCHPVDYQTGLAVCDQPSPGGLVAEGEMCEFRNDCGESAVCHSDATCRDLCDYPNWQTLDVPHGGCAMGRTCMPYGDAMSPGFPGLGVCEP